MRFFGLKAPPRASLPSRHPGPGSTSGVNCGRDPRQGGTKSLLSWVPACAGMMKVWGLIAVASFFSALSLNAATLNGLAVDVVNQSEPVLCAEKDNVTLALSSPVVKSFRIEAAHPAYIGALQRDSFEADWTACDLKGDPSFKSDVGVTSRRTLYEEPALWIVGWTFPTYWRPATATVRIGDKIEKGLHMLQIWTIRPMGGEELLVLYPQDGYWRIRPKAPQGVAPTAFGSSFLVGPVEVEGRPIVKISDVAIDPKTQTLTVSFVRGGAATVKIASVDQNKHSLDVNLSAPVVGAPFAMLRSMYVTEFNNDVARVAVREAGAPGWHEDGIMTFKGAKATDVWAGRSTISRHNSSSPDMVFGGFSDKARQ